MQLTKGIGEWPPSLQACKDSRQDDGFAFSRERKHRGIVTRLLRKGKTDTYDNQKPRYSKVEDERKSLITLRKYCLRI
jgi:hypothetical protein